LQKHDFHQATANLKKTKT